MSARWHPCRRFRVQESSHTRPDGRLRTHPEQRADDLLDQSRSRADHTDATGAAVDTLWTVAYGRKEAPASARADQGFLLERTTRFELATLTLAR